jgi:hypothetical protein
MQTWAAKLNTIANIKASTINQRLNKLIILHQTHTSSQRVLKTCVTSRLICPFWARRSPRNLFQTKNGKACTPEIVAVSLGLLPNGKACSIDGAKAG